MPIYRGSGGSGNSNTSANANQVAIDSAAAAQSANDANTAKLLAQTAQNAAETAETNAETSETNANTSAGISTTKADIATTQAGIAATQAGTATTQAGTATTQAGIAATQAGTATTQAGIATTQAGIAATQAGTATTQAGTASTQAGIATTQAGIAAAQAGTATTKASEASGSASAAATSAAAAQAAQEAIDGLYLGAQASDPTLDLNGDPVTVGDWYFNTTINKSKIYNGSGWDVLTSNGSVTSVTGTGTVNGVTLTGTVTAAGNLTLGGTLSGITASQLNSQNISQWTNDSGYITSAVETDTLDSVTGRGATTTNAVTVGNLTSTGIDDNATSTAITIDSSERVGINVTPTTRALEVKSISNAQIITSFKTGSGITGRISIMDANTTADSTVGIGCTGNNLDFYAGAAAKATLSATGNLSVIGNLTSRGIDDNATSTAVTIDSSQNVGISNDLTVDTDTLVVDSTNNRVGINVSDPDAVLEVFTSDYATGPYFHGGGSLGLRIADSTITSAGDRTEFYKPTSSGMFSFKNGLKELLTIKASGRIGSDETNPQDRIHIKGSLPALRLENTAGAADSYTRIASIDGAVRIQADQGNSTANSFIAFDVDTVEAARITSSGNFGIGTPTPAVILETNVASGNNEIRQSVGGTPTAQLISSTTNQYLVNLGSGVQSFWTGGSERMRINNSGATFTGSITATNAVLEGTTDSILTLRSTDDGPLYMEFERGTDRHAYLGISSTGDDFYIKNEETNGDIRLQTQDGSELRINAGGNVEVTSGQLNVSTDIYAVNNVVSGNGSGATALTTNDGGGNANLTFNHIGTSPDINGNAFRIETNVDSTSNGYMNFEGKSNVTQNVNVTLNDMARMYADSGDFHANGNVIAYSTTISDERLKENVEQVTGALDMLDQVRGVTFDRKDTGKKSAGVIAQELEKVMPYAIYETALPLKTGSEDDVYKLVEYDALHAVLIEAIKELRAEVETLKNAI